MHFVHLEYIIGGSKHHLSVLRQNHGLKYIDDLGDVGHFQTVGVFMEYVQGQGGNESVAHGILLVKMAVDGSGFFVPPSSPFVQ